MKTIGSVEITKNVKKARYKKKSGGYGTRKVFTNEILGMKFKDAEDKVFASFCSGSFETHGHTTIKIPKGHEIIGLSWSNDKDLM